ncbi:hypothetical protein FACS189450_08780 [Spirochaetia bacterium]|nr:hypothetical protein FACS189450_08780 [Spirochaetia bacterium]
MLLQDMGNFREIHCGAIVPGTLYRSAHPMTEGEPDCAIAQWAQNARIACVLNLHDAPQALPGIKAPWYEWLVHSGRVAALDMHMDFRSEEFCRKLAWGLRFMMALQGPYLIHCYAGVDRTGFVSAVLEALMGATVREIETDYLRSFEKETIAYFAESGLHPTIFEQLTRMNGGIPVTDGTARQAAEAFLTEDVGLNPTEVAALRERLMQPVS